MPVQWTSHGNYVTHTTPWFLKFWHVLCIWLQCRRVRHLNTRMPFMSIEKQLPVMYACFFCSVVLTFLPSACAAVRDRYETTRFAVQVCMYMCVCSALVQLSRHGVTSYNATLVFLVMTTLHVVFSMGRALHLNPKLLVSGKLTSYYFLFVSVFMPMIWTVYISHIPDTRTCVFAIFVGDTVAGVAVFLQVLIETVSAHLSRALYA